MNFSSRIIHRPIRKSSFRNKSLAELLFLHEMYLRLFIRTFANSLLFQKFKHSSRTHGSRSISFETYGMLFSAFICSHYPTYSGLEHTFPEPLVLTSGAIDSFSAAVLARLFARWRQDLRLTGISRVTER